MMVNTSRLSKDDDELDSNMFRSSHLTSTDSTSPNTTPMNSMFYSRSSRANTLHSSPITDMEERSRSNSVPISPLHHLDAKEYNEIAQMELELQFKTLEMLALIKGTTPRQAFEAERLQDEIRSLRDRSHDDDLDSSIHTYHTPGGAESWNKSEVSQIPTVVALLEAPGDEEDDFLVGDSYLDEEALKNSLETMRLQDERDDDEEEDIFGMEL